MIKNLEVSFQLAMDDDFNTPKALAVLFDIVKRINSYKSSNHIKAATSLGFLLNKLSSILGVLERACNDYFSCSDNNVAVDKILDMIEARNNARVNKEWAKADEIRDWFNDNGIVVEDSSNGTTWRYKNS